MNLDKLLINIRQCEICKSKLPYPPNPLLQVGYNARILILGQAPGEKAHFKNTLFDDMSGERLRSCLGVNNEDFYNKNIFNIIPIGFCFPGVVITNSKRKGDKPPRPECRATWHPVLLPKLDNVELVILLGKYAIDYYLAKNTSVTTEVFNQENRDNNIFVIPHPSPRNNIWLSKNPTFEATILPILKEKIAIIIEQHKSEIHL
ncbi:uracil-DNA glycosylase family protein [Photobacterium toruni]|uniref:Uracil DNA glycosylase superfamily protein n=1 Tax=Photobacterium toruni TaxID=1935446 RepID=A0A1T4SSX5_9GAMM|nr:uracil-DNA glycosylase family protein [Photobacterium toruni]SKA31410.1 Uracil DNA glycosylase superfamily protein [Photobacterium toruni]